MSRTIQVSKQFISFQLSRYFKFNYRVFRQQQKDRVFSKNTSHLSDEDFWKTSSENCPETRVEIANRHRKDKESTNEKKDLNCKRSIRLFNKEGNPLNVNQAKLDFEFFDDSQQFVLDIVIYKYLDTNLIEIDLQPIYVKISIKGKL